MAEVNVMAYNNGIVIFTLGNYKDHICLIDELDFQVHVYNTICWSIAGAKSTKNKVNYVKKGVPKGNNKHTGSMRLHNLICINKTDLVIDHINGNGLDNRNLNLQLLSIGENLHKGKPKSQHNIRECKGKPHILEFLTLHKITLFKTNDWGNITALRKGKHIASGMDIDILYKRIKQKYYEEELGAEAAFAKSETHQ